MIGGNPIPPDVQIVQKQQYAYTYFVHSAKLTYVYTYGIIQSESNREPRPKRHSKVAERGTPKIKRILQDAPKLKSLT